MTRVQGSRLVDLWNAASVAAFLTLPFPLLGPPESPPALVPALQSVREPVVKVSEPPKASEPAPAAVANPPEKVQSIALQSGALLQVDVPSLLQESVAAKKEPAVAAVSEKLEQPPLPVQSEPTETRPLLVERKELMTPKPAIGMPTPLAESNAANEAEPKPEGVKAALTLVSLLTEKPQGKSVVKSTIQLPSRPPQEKPKEVKPAPVIGTANRITVPSIEIDIAVRPGVYDEMTSSWMVDDGSAFHADTTVPVNDSNGTTLIYGHAKWGIFGALPATPPGAEATVYTAEGVRFVYVLDSVQEVDPSDISMLTTEGAPKLVLQTCSGIFDQHRTLAAFHLKEVIRDQA